MNLRNLWIFIISLLAATPLTRVLVQFGMSDML